jgi:hypothetical protein
MQHDKKRLTSSTGPDIVNVVILTHGKVPFFARVMARFDLTIHANGLALGQIPRVTSSFHQ